MQQQTPMPFQKVRAEGDRTGHYLDEMAVGMTATYSKTLTEADIILYCGLSGDTNPIHVDEEYAGKTRFRGRIAQGMLTASFISTVMGTMLPGPGVVYVSQQLRFKAPVRIGETVRAQVTVTQIDAERQRVWLSTQCFVKQKLVIDGEAETLVPKREDI